MAEEAEYVSPATAVRETVEAICLANQVMPLGWILVVEGAPMEGGESLAMFTPADQATHRTLGQLDYAVQWFHRDVAQQWHQAPYDDEDDD